MPKTDCRLYVVAMLLMSPASTVFSQNQSVILRLTGDQTKSSSDGLASAPQFMPGISGSYYVRDWGIIAEYGAFSSPGQLNLETYTKNIQDFTTRNINSTEWKTSYFLAGIAYRKSLGPGLQAGVDLTGGILDMKPASYSINDNAEGTSIADAYAETKTSTVTGKALFALKPEIRLEWFPAQGPLGLNIHAGYLRAFGASEVSTYYRDLSGVRFDGVSEQDIRAQVLKAPIIESRSHGPVSNMSFGAGISLKIGAAKKSTTQTEETGIENQASIHLHKANIVHRDIAARKIVHRDIAVRNLIAGRLEWNPAGNEQGIITNESAASGTENEAAAQHITSLTISARGTGINGSPENSGGFLPVFKDGKAPLPDQDTALVFMKTSPLYSGSQATGSNVFHNSNAQITSNPLYHGGGHSGQNPLSTARIDIVLTDAETGDVLASTRTDENGDFFFANVPEGQYAVHVLGTVTISQSYDLHANGDADISGIVTAAGTQPVLSLVTEAIPNSFDEQQARQRVAALTSEKSVAPNASCSRQPLKTHFETGDKPTSSQRTQPGNPIGGIIVKGGKNPGGILMTTATDNNGWFEWHGLKAGDYKITLIQTITINDAMQVSDPNK